MNLPEIKESACDLMVIGSGMAGMAAALFAAQHKIDTVQVGITGEINFASGFLDLLGVHPVEKGTCHSDPWAAMAQLVRDEPDHPYARLSIAQVHTAMDTFLDFLGRSGLPYHSHGLRNMKVVTPVGTIKTTYAIPRTMAAGAQALADGTPALLVDFFGLKGYSARQISETLKSKWPGLKTKRITFPGTKGELYTEHAARTLEVGSHRKKLANAIGPHLGSAQAVGLPAILGIYNPGAVLADLENTLGVRIFEIPTMVPSITGLRLRERLEEQIPKKGVRAFYQQKILETQVSADGDFLFLVGVQKPEMRIRARAAILASGRFFGKGLHADRIGIRESIFNLPVVQPDDRTLWHHKDLFHSGGHPINRSGLAIDDQFHPVDEKGDTIYNNLFVCGSILANQDWIRQKCGSGLSIATAYGAVEAYMANMGS